MRVERGQRLPDVLRIRPACHHDPRGWFATTWDRAAWRAAGIAAEFVEEHRSWSRQGVLRGLHYQLEPPQGKLVSVLLGEVYDVALDLRASAPTFGRWEAFRLDGREPTLLYLPPGFAHGFAVCSDEALIQYKTTAPWSPASARVIAWNDPALAIPWPVAEPLLSDRDRHGTPWHDAEPLP